MAPLPTRAGWLFLGALLVAALASGENLAGDVATWGASDDLSVEYSASGHPRPRKLNVVYDKWIQIAEGKSSWSEYALIWISLCGICVAFVLWHRRHDFYPDPDPGSPRVNFSAPQRPVSEPGEEGSEESMPEAYETHEVSTDSVVKGHKRLSLIRDARLEFQGAKDVSYSPTGDAYDLEPLRSFDGIGPATWAQATPSARTLKLVEDSDRLPSTAATSQETSNVAVLTPRVDDISGGMEDAAMPPVREKPAPARRRSSLSGCASVEVDAASGRLDLTQGVEFVPRLFTEDVVEPPLALYAQPDVAAKALDTVAVALQSLTVRTRTEVVRLRSGASDALPEQSAWQKRLEMNRARLVMEDLISRGVDPCLLRASVLPGDAPGTYLQLTIDEKGPVGGFGAGPANRDELSEAGALSSVTPRTPRILHEAFSAQEPGQRGEEVFQPFRSEPEVGSSARGQDDRRSKGWRSQCPSEGSFRRSPDAEPNDPARICEVSFSARPGAGADDELALEDLEAAQDARERAEKLAEDARLAERVAADAAIEAVKAKAEQLQQQREECISNRGNVTYDALNNSLVMLRGLECTTLATLGEDGRPQVAFKNPAAAARTLDDAADLMTLLGNRGADVVALVQPDCGAAYQKWRGHVAGHLRAEFVADHLKRRGVPTDPVEHRGAEDRRDAGPEGIRIGVCGDPFRTVGDGPDGTTSPLLSME